MLNIFKSKPILKDLIPNNYVDIHSHLLPGIDDGAKNIEDTIALVGSLQKIGFKQFITTPHIMHSIWENTKEGIETKYEKTAGKLKSIYPDISIKVAAEYFIDAHFQSLFQNAPLLVLKDNYVLVEISYINPPIQLFDIIFELQLAGYKPVLAHPERYSFYHQNFKQYEKLKHMGCLFQLNLLSTIGYYGLDVAKTADLLLKKGMIDFVGSDVHHKNHIDGFDKKILIKEFAPLKEAINNNQFFSF